MSASAIALDRGEWGAEIMAHRHEELAFECVRSLEVVGHRVDRGDQLADLVSAGGCPVGDRASRSPAAMRRATSRDARMGPVSDRLTRPATSAATTMVASEASKNQRNDGIRSGSGSSVITTSCRVPFLLTYPRAAQRRSPSRLLCVSPARSRSVSRSSTVRPSGRLPIGSGCVGAPGCRCRRR